MAVSNAASIFVVVLITFGAFSFLICGFAMKWSAYRQRRAREKRLNDPSYLPTYIESSIPVRGWNTLPDLESSGIAAPPPSYDLETARNHQEHIPQWMMNEISGQRARGLSSSSSGGGVDHAATEAVESNTTGNSSDQVAHDEDGSQRGDNVEVAVVNVEEGQKDAPESGEEGSAAETPADTPQPPRGPTNSELAAIDHTPSVVENGTSAIGDAEEVDANGQRRPLVRTLTERWGPPPSYPTPSDHEPTDPAPQPTNS
ncbi:hypothetical protein HDV00_008913 [Rhizophlyctis rosea]|nr:hypothetical protein HDV00_008913 [Rhizophlyctis rosea]